MRTVDELDWHIEHVLRQARILWANYNPGDHNEARL
jgi:hypothetical protein